MFKSLVKLGETEYCCLRNTIQPPGRFAYNLRVPGKIKTIQRITLIKSQKIFDLYQTSDNEETQKPKKARMYAYMYCMLILMVFAVVFAGYKISSMGDTAIAKEKEKSISKPITQKNISRSRPQKSDFVPTNYNPKQIDDDHNLKWQKRNFYTIDNRVFIQHPDFDFVEYSDYGYSLKINGFNIYALIPVETGELPQDSSTGMQGEREEI